MRIVGERIELRPLMLRDVTAWLEIKWDWPVDALGHYTFERAQRDVEANVRANEKVTRPLDQMSQWTETLVAVIRDNVIGLCRHHALGTVCTVAQQAMHPAWRGNGYFSEMNELLARYAFDTLGATEVHHELIGAAAAAHAFVNNRSRYREDGERQGETGKLRKGSMTRESFDAWRATAAPRPFQFEP